MNYLTPRQISIQNYSIGLFWGNKVIDHEDITGCKGVDILECIAIYEVDETTITKAHFIK